MFRKLYIIGNGFDIHHGLKTSYADFHKWLQQQNDYSSVEEMECFFAVDDLWKNFEENLGKLDYPNIVMEIARDHIPSPAEEHYEARLSDAQVEVETMIKEWRNYIQNGLAKWIKCVGRPDASKRLSLDPDAFYITFNYTKTLENLYSIAAQNILHIHGCIGGLPEHLVLGHGGAEDHSISEIAYEPKIVDGEVDDSSYDESYEISKQFAFTEAKAIVKGWEKPIDTILARNDAALVGLASVEEVVVLGLSFSDADRRYFARFREIIPNTAKWKVSWFGESDKRNIRLALRGIGIKYALIRMEDLQINQSVMKDIRIFVASSKELIAERNALAYLVLSKEEEFAARGFRVRLSKWEYVDPTMTEARTEDRYLDEMYNCDAVLMLFRHVLGKYTKEEVDKAIEAETAGTSRIKKHLILFKEVDADESPELAAWRASLSDGAYGAFTDAAGLGEHFLQLVEEIAGLPLQDAADTETERTISAFLAVDDELAADRDAFADAVLNLNDVLSRRGVRVRLQFYDPVRHRDMLDSSEMALVLYQTKCGEFGGAELKEAYDRSKREQNPRRLYVFFRDASGRPLDDAFQALKDGFAKTFGSAPCWFENVDTLSLNFLFALESMLGDGAGTFVKLDGRTVVADGLDVGDLTKLPMLAKNEGLTELFSRMADVSKRFVAQREKCDRNPQDDGLYVELLDLSSEKNRLQDQIDRELKMAFNLAKRLAAISMAQVSETIARARAKVEVGQIKEALEILDGASAAMKRRRLLHSAADRAEAEELQIKELKASAEIEYFRVDAVMAYTAMPFEERFKKVEGIYKSLVEDVGTFAEMCAARNKDRMDLMHADALRKFARCYGIVSDSLSPIPLLEKAGRLYESVEDRGGRCSPLKRIAVLSAIASAHESNNQLALAEEEFSDLLHIVKAYAVQNGGKGKWRQANTLKHLSQIHYKSNHFEKARKVALEGLNIFQGLEDKKSGIYGDDISEMWNILACVCKKLDAVEDAKRYYINALRILRERLPAHPSERYLLAGILGNYGQFLNAQDEKEQAETILKESLSLWREEVVQNPVAYAEHLRGTLAELAIIYYCSDRNEEARDALEECIQIDRRNAVRNPDRFLPDLQATLFNLGVLLEDDDQNAAARYYEESLSICRKIAKSTPSRYLRRLVKTLSGYGDFIEEIGDEAKAKVLYLEEQEMARSIVNGGEEGAAWLVAMALNDIAWLHQHQKDFREAEKYFEKLLVVRRELAVKNPRRYSDDVARTQEALENVKEELGKLDEAVRLYAEAIDLRRNLAKSNPTKFEGTLARTLHNMGGLQVRMSNYDAAKESFAEALQIRTRLVEHDPDKYQKVLDGTKAELIKLEMLGGKS